LLVREQAQHAGKEEFFVNVVFHFRRSPKRSLHRSGIAGALAASFLSFSPSVRAQTSACALTGDASVSSADITAAVNMALGTAPCTANVEGPLTCTVITVQRVINASLGGPCVVYNAHAAKLSWTASTTPSVTYNVYRATASTGPFTTPLNSSPITGTTYTDTAVTAGQTYYYVVTAVASSGTQSADSNTAQATIPSP
jgi:cellulose 1,4-beta-cellobiosidase